MFARLCMHAGLHVFGYTEYPSLIRGGHNTYQAYVSEKKIRAQVHLVDVLIALNKETISLHLDELADQAAIIYDIDKVQVDDIDLKGKQLHFYPIPLTKCAKESGGSDVMMNNVALGATLAVLDYDIANLHALIEETFGKKGEKIVKINKDSAHCGYDFVKRNFPQDFHIKLRSIGTSNRILIAANEAMGMGAIAAGCKFYVAYPMTPTSSILHFMAEYGPKYGVLVRHAEDEIGVINQAVGAGYAGVRVMCATSGGGFSLMTEGYGLAAMTETPVVIVEGQRPGPATGLPTWTEQGDLRFVLHAHQGDFPRIVLAPGDTQEAFFLTAEAFNIAERYQTPVILLTDKHLGESHESTEPFEYTKITIDHGELISDETLTKETDYKRYQFTDSGISPRSLPGQAGGVYLANSDEHDEHGDSVEGADNRTRMVEKRMRKFTMLEKSLPKPTLYGPESADVTILSFGSTKGAIFDAIDILEQEKILVNFLQVTFLSPFPTQAVKEVVTKAKKTLVVEGNYTGQFESLIREHCLTEVHEHLRRYDGRPFYALDIVTKVKEMAK